MLSDDERQADIHAQIERQQRQREWLARNDHPQAEQLRRAYAQWLADKFSLLPKDQDERT